jgi:hypothetical protein
MSVSSELTWILGSRKADNMGMLIHSHLLGFERPVDTIAARRGKSGGQVRDEYRDEYDPGRGGYGRAVAEERAKEEREYGSGK